jgi:benzoyl-CoA reductase subunit C
MLNTLVKIARAPLSDWPNRYPGQQAMGYLCSYVPEEIIHAAGLVPVRVRGTTAPLGRVDAHLQSFTCALCRSTLDQILSGELDFLVGTVFAHTCDAMQAQADLWRINTGQAHFVDTVMQPVNLGTPAARPYLVAELNRFRERLAAFTGTAITTADLWASITLYDETRRLVSKLQDVHGHPSVRTHLSVCDYFAVLDAAQVMPRKEFNLLLAQLLDSATALQRDDALPYAVGPRLFLVGAVLDEPRLLDLLQDLGAQVVGDDLCSGSRHFYDQVSAEGDPAGADPIDALANYYLRRPPCPTKLHPTHDSDRYLLDQMRQVQAQGVIFVVEKFCEPYAFDYALIRLALDKANVPYLLLEMEQMPSLEALRTRLQAFVEIL